MKNKLYIGKNYAECKNFYSNGGPSPRDVDYLFCYSADYPHINLVPKSGCWIKETRTQDEYIPVEKVASEIYDYKSVSFISVDALKAFRKLTDFKKDKEDKKCRVCLCSIGQDTKCWWCGTRA